MNRRPPSVVDDRAQQRPLAAAERLGRARVILLNGASSSGKSTLAAALQQQLPVPFLRVGVDDVIAMHPDRRALGWLVPEAGGCRIELKPAGHRLMRAFHAAVAGFVAAGERVIVDDMFVHPDLLTGWLDALAGSRVLLVGVHCSLDEAERRERAREDRAPGLARGHHQTVHTGCRYDLELDTTERTSAECVRVICAAWQAGIASPAFTFRAAPASGGPLLAGGG